MFGGVMGAFGVMSVQAKVDEITIVPDTENRGVQEEVGRQRGNH
jgi:hypothetical protein